MKNDLFMYKERNTKSEDIKLNYSWIKKNLVK